MNGPYPPGDAPPLKRRWAAGLWSLLFPGVGHMYAGAMQRGLFFSLLLIGNIFGVVLVSIHGIVPLIVLLAVLIPVVYLYALFDALQTTDRVNARLTDASRGPNAVGRANEPSFAVPPPQAGTPAVFDRSKVGLALAGLGAFLFLKAGPADWVDPFVRGNGGLIVAGAFIGIGVWLYLADGKKNG